MERGKGQAVAKPVRAKAEGLAESHRRCAVDEPHCCPPSRGRASTTTEHVAVVICLPRNMLRLRQHARHLSPRHRPFKIAAEHVSYVNVRYKCARVLMKCMINLVPWYTPQPPSADTTSCSRVYSHSAWVTPRQQFQGSFDDGNTGHSRKNEEAFSCRRWQPTVGQVSSPCSG